MKILIIGSNGFLGEHVSDYFSSEHTVITADISDRKSTAHVVIDAENPDFLSIFEGQHFDVCINCSGAANVSQSIDEPYQDYSINVIKLFQILEAIRKSSPTTKFIHLSSAAVYGNPVTLPITEKAEVLPVSPYGFHKQQAEIVCREFYQQYNIPTISLRIFSAYGPMLCKQIFWDVYEKAKDKCELRLFGSGQETRDFIFVKDIVKAIHCAIDHAEFTGEGVNIANGSGITINEAVRTFLDLLQWNGTLKFTGQERVGDPIHWQADIHAIQKMGYSQEYSLSSGLLEVVNWLKEQK